MLHPRSPWQKPPWALLAAVVLAHALLLGAAPPQPAAPSVRPVAPRPTTLVRVVHMPAVTPAAPPAPTIAPPTQSTPAQRLVESLPPKAPAARPTPPPARVRSELARAAGGAPQPARAALAMAEAGAAPPPPAALTARSGPTDEKAGPSAPALDVSDASRMAATVALDDAPFTAAQLPPSASLDYRVHGTARGLAFEAEAQLLWRRDGARYEAEWTVRLPLLGQRTQRSEGTLGAAGLAPERYAEQARGERAAHFDAAGGRIRFSANTPDAALQPGAQDRLSVSLQLGGLIAAAPAQHPPGSTLTLQTAGVREAEAWRWEVLADETLQIDGREVRCTKLVRQPRRDYDTRVELWLARPYGYLPARLRVTQANGDSVDQLLRALPPS